MKLCQPDENEDCSENVIHEVDEPPLSHHQGEHSPQQEQGEPSLQQDDLFLQQDGEQVVRKIEEPRILDQVCPPHQADHPPHLFHPLPSVSSRRYGAQKQAPAPENVGAWVAPQQKVYEISSKLDDPDPPKQYDQEESTPDYWEEIGIEEVLFLLRDPNLRIFGREEGDCPHSSTGTEPEIKNKNQNSVKLISQEITEKDTNNDTKMEDDVNSNNDDEKYIGQAELEEVLNNQDFGMDTSILLPQPEVSIDDIKKDLNCPEEFKDELAKAILENKVSSLHQFDCGCINRDEPLKIKLKDGASVPKNTRIYRLNDTENEFLRSFLLYLEQEDLVEKSPHNAQYGSPLFLVARKGAQSLPRLVVDSRACNTVIEDASEISLGDIYSNLQTFLPEVRWITLIDLRQAFYSILIDKETLDSGLCNIISQAGCYRLKRIATGLNVAPSALVYFINKWLYQDLSGLKFQFNSAFLCHFDDISMGSSRIMKKEQVLQDNIDLITRLSRMGGKLNLKKTFFMVDTTKVGVEILGYWYENYHLHVPKKKKAQITNMTFPRSLKELQSFLGSLCYYRNLLNIPILEEMGTLYKFIPHFEQNEISLSAFNSIIKKLETAELQVDLRSKAVEIFVLFTDASIFSLGGVLFSVDATKFIEREDYDNIEDLDLPDIQPLLEENIKIIVKGKSIFHFLQSVAIKLNLVHTEDSFRKLMLMHINFNIRYAYWLPYGEEELTSYFSKFKERMYRDFIEHPNETPDPYIESYLLMTFSNLFKVQIRCFARAAQTISDGKFVHADVGFWIPEIQILCYDETFYLMYTKEENKKFDMRATHAVPKEINDKVLIDRFFKRAQKIQKFIGM